MPRYTSRAARFRDPRTGRFVTEARVRSDLDLAVQKANRRAVKLADDFRAGRISGLRWQTEMRALIKDTHIYAAVVAKGGNEAMTPADWGRLGNRLRFHYNRLDVFGAQIRAGLPLDGHFTQRVTLYTEAARNTFERTRNEVERQNGKEEERNVLKDGALHCEGVGSCPGETAKGWQPIGSLIPVGERLCGPRCRCRLIYRRQAA